MLGEHFEEMLYGSVEFSGWLPRCVPGYELARVRTKLDGKMDCDFIEAWIDQDLQVIDDIYWRKVQAGLDPAIADDIEDKSLESYFDLLRLRDLRLTALENLENYGMIME
ncbi:hypothetical protein BPOR_0175g00040 [Botrytis porri]|uniref:Uncharacterized protein n=1 Tax=Botrytis porri TaxID=87229 RepID=A0A4Z1KUM9_9HELO|nr:hypothetical protein BPOR_0175g00040 [Botrytis porri]